MTDARPPLGVTRSNLAERTIETLRRGNWNSPDVLLIESDAGRAVVKDFGPRSWLVRSTLGRWLVRREMQIYRALVDHPAVPRLLGCIDSLAFALEHREGVRFSRRLPRTFSPEFEARLRDAVRGLHDRGVVHLDLRHRSNIRAAPDGSPVLLDFDAAVRFRRGSWEARLLLPLLARIDERGLAKWSERIARSSDPGS